MYLECCDFQPDFAAAHEEEQTPQADRIGDCTKGGDLSDLWELTVAWIAHRGPENARSARIVENRESFYNRSQNLQRKIDAVNARPTLVIMLASALAIFACGSESSKEVTPRPSLATNTPIDALPTKDPKSSSSFFEICTEVLPQATLRAGEESQSDVLAAFDWNSDGCTGSAHGFDTIRLPNEALVLAAGTRAELTLSRAPESLQAILWAPDFALAKPLDASGIEVPFGEPSRPNRLTFNLDAANVHELPQLGDLAPGDYAFEIFGSWPEGTAGFAFRFVVAEAQASPTGP